MTWNNRFNNRQTIDRVEQVLLKITEGINQPSSSIGKVENVGDFKLDETTIKSEVAGDFKLEESLIESEVLAQNNHSLECDTTTNLTQNTTVAENQEMKIPMKETLIQFLQTLGFPQLLQHDRVREQLGV